MEERGLEASYAQKAGEVAQQVKAPGSQPAARVQSRDLMVEEKKPATTYGPELPFSSSQLWLLCN